MDPFPLLCVESMLSTQYVICVGGVSIWQGVRKLLGLVKNDQDWSGLIRTCQCSLGLVKNDQDLSRMIRLVRNDQDRPGMIRTGHDWSGLVRNDQDL